MINKRLISLLLIIIAMASLLTLTYQKRQVIGKKYLKVGDRTVFVEVANTDASRSKGLGYRDSLATDSGMLFVFDEAKRWSFWMEGMRFGLDFLWIEKNRVVDISENVPPPSQTNNTPVFLNPSTQVHYVLEVNEGWIKKNNVRIGDYVEFYL